MEPKDNEDGGNIDNTDTSDSRVHRSVFCVPPEQITNKDSIVLKVIDRESQGTIELRSTSLVDEIFDSVKMLFYYVKINFELIAQYPNGDEIVLNHHLGQTLSAAGLTHLDQPETKPKIILKPFRTEKALVPYMGGLDSQGIANRYIYNDDNSSIRKPNVIGQLNVDVVVHDPITNTNSKKYVGLVNQAMTCYLNSLLQALYMTPEFRNALYNWEFDGNNPDNSIPFQLQRLFLNLQTSDRSSVETTDLTHSFGWNMQQAWEQHDIQELCRVMFDALEQKFRDTKQANLINDLYEGKMMDYVKCLECSTEKCRADTFQDIPLPVRPFGSSIAYKSVEEALAAFVQPETLDGNNQYHCEKCNKKCDAHKGLKFMKFPYLLTLHLKRFDFDYSTMNRIKLNDKVIFPEILNLNSFVMNTGLTDDSLEERDATAKGDDCSTTDSGSALDEECVHGGHDNLTNNTEENSQDDDEGIDVSNNENEKNRLQEPKGPYVYELFSIMIHSGSATGGHYYAYIKDFRRNEWFCFNDQTVTPVTHEDIEKSYGGGTRNYYSGSYSSSTNAYMLMYRQLDEKRNCQAYTAPEFPPHIKKLFTDMQNKEEQDRIAKEKEQGTCKLKIYCYHPSTKNLMAAKIFGFYDFTIEEILNEAYQKFKLQDLVELEHCKLAVFNKDQEVIECYLENEQLLLRQLPRNTEFLVEIYGDHMKAYHFDIQTEKMQGPDNVWVTPKDTVSELKAKLAKLYNLDSVHVVLRVGTNHVEYLEDDSALVKFDIRRAGYKLYVASTLEPAEPQQGYAFSKFATLVEQFKHVVMLDITLPDTDVGTLEHLSIPSLDVNQNSDRIEIGAGDRASNSSSNRVSPQPTNEISSDQSNSEDSSLSDNDKTLIGDAPGDNLCILSSNSNSPPDQRMISPTDEYAIYYDDMCYKSEDHMSWEEEDMPPANYYFKMSWLKKEAEGEEGRCCRIFADRDITLGRLKKKLEPILGVPVEYFKVFREYPSQDCEWTHLADTLQNVKDGGRLLIKLGRVLKRNEKGGSVYHFNPDKSEPYHFLFEWVIAENDLVSTVKREILLQAKKQHMLDIPFAKCRLRKKLSRNPSKIYLDEERFVRDILIPNNFELLIYEHKGPEKLNGTQLFLFLRQWKPASLEISPITEISIPSRDVNVLKEVISDLSKIPLEFVEIATFKQQFPCDLNVLEVHQAREWNPKAIDNATIDIYDDGYVFYYRDNREKLKELTPDERKELSQSENKRLGRFAARLLSPRREHGLKIYVDNMPKKEDDVALD